MITLEQSPTEHTEYQIRSKDEFELLFNTFYSHLCSFANGFLKDLDASEEIVQEVMLKVWINRENLVITSSMQSYLFKAVRNGCLNMLKHISIREEYKFFKEREDSIVQRSHEEEVMFTEMEVNIRNAIDRLPVERRRVFIMSRYDGMTYREIADKMGISVKTVENQMSNVLKFLREELAEYLPLFLLVFYIMEN